MPRRDDLTSVLVLGSGPIVIGQACEFDYSGTQACKVLREEGLRVVLVNSNPATIMTDPAFADATYVEPLTVETVTKILEKERPDAILPTLGGQTALNLAVELHQSGILERLGVETLGRRPRRDPDRRGPAAVQGGDDRDRAREPAVDLRAGRRTRPSGAADEYGYPVVLRPSYTLGGKGGGIAYDADQLRAMIRQGLHDSPVHEVLVEESVLGWKEYELEVMRDHHDNCVVICSIENIDAMGVHTGDSITVAPAMTLSDPEYQQMRDASFAVLRRIGVETGGSNVQFAVDPVDRPPGRHRDEPARVAVLGAGLQGHRVPDRQDRRAAGHRLLAGRDRQRHHARDQGGVRAHASTTSSPRSRASRSRSSAAPTTR